MSIFFTLADSDLLKKSKFTTRGWLYENVFDKDLDVREKSIFEVIDAVLAKIPESLRTLVKTMLQKSRSQRPSMEEVSRELEKYPP